ncbi:methyl-CpG-binding domain-containing family protein [Tripterygium wilfordii]|uniref:Methyl-CpG-binding domain-containing family protein n=2 Tax=Tripterygium wilfordii TaxID=458696 RepID=A0A7J7DD13_TRIWF|nr:methyl-CpG-binding domain-containing family protein [Tripterygium wilfordii]
MAEELPDKTLKTPKSSLSKSLRRKGSPLRSVDTYAAQCIKCLKWRVITTEEEYEDIRNKVSVEPFVCARKSGASCEDPADIENDGSQTWAIDKPGIPRTPEGFKRILVLRSDYSKMDAYYVTPTKKRLKCHSEVAAFLEANPGYQGVSLSNFNFSTPKVVEDTIPDYIVRKGSADGNSNARVEEPEDAAESGSCGNQESGVTQ